MSFRLEFLRSRRGFCRVKNKIKQKRNGYKNKLNFWILANMRSKQCSIKGSLRRLSEESQNEILKYLLEFKDILSTKIASINRFRLIYFILSFIPIVLLFFFNKENEYLVLFKNVALTLIFVYLGVYLCFMKSLEKKTLAAVLDDVSVMANQFSSNEEEERQQTNMSFFNLSLSLSHVIFIYYLFLYYHYLLLFININKIINR